MKGSSALSKGGSAANTHLALAIAGAILLVSAPNANAQMAKSAKVVLQACKPDIARLCSTVQAGGGRVKACMKEHIHQLSEPCKEALFQAWLRH